MQPPPYGPPPGQQGYGAPPGAPAPGGYGAPPGYGAPAGYPPVQAGPGGMQGAPSAGDKQTAALAHASNIVFWGIGPLVIYFMKKDDPSPFVKFHVTQSLYLMLAGYILTAVTCGIGALPLLILNIMGAVKANNGEMYEYPVVGEMARKSVFGR